MKRATLRIPLVLTVLGLTLMAVAGLAADVARLDPLAVEGPVADAFFASPASNLAATVAVPMDLAAVQLEDSERESSGLAPRFAIPEDVWLTPENSGTWEDLDGRFVMWRTRISAPGALSINLGFTGYWLPPGARLGLYPTDVTGPDDKRGEPVFTAADNEDHGQLWTPVILADDIVVELVLPRSERHNYRLELTAINQGYRFFGATADRKAGTCNIDVVCSEADDWRSEINSVGAISTGGSLFCTGTMVNNTAVDGTPYFLTANHCGINTSTAPSLVVYWNFQSPVCGDQSGGLLDDFSTGALFRANSATSDFDLVELDDPVDPAFGVTYAGWNRADTDPTSATAIHHPRGDEKSISFENDPTSTTTYLQSPVPGDGTHIRVADWDLGTTEPGSSGCPLFDQNHHLVGQLHGGYAACGNDLSDWFGRFSVSWEGGGTPATRLRDYLDPGNTGVMTLEMFDPQAASFAVTPVGDAASEGIVGGAFTPDEFSFTLANTGGSAVGFTVGSDSDWLVVDQTSGTIALGQSVVVTATISAGAASLPVGIHRAVLDFVNPAGGGGTTSRTIVLSVTENALHVVGPVPNPFSIAPVEIRFTLRGAATVRASIVNMRGLAVRDLGSMAGAAGANALTWDGLDDDGHRVPSGVYVVQIKALGRVSRVNLSYVH